MTKAGYPLSSILFLENPDYYSATVNGKPVFKNLFKHSPSLLLCEPMLSWEVE